MHHFNSRPKVLVVDDVEVIRMLARKILTAAGYEVVSTSSAIQAIQVVLRSPPNLAVVDIEMPGPDGLQLCRWLRSREPDPIPAVIMTAHTDRRCYTEAVFSGSASFVAKPRLVHDLAPMVRQALAGSALQPGAATPADAESPQAALGLSA